MLHYFFSVYVATLNLHSATSSADNLSLYVFKTRQLISQTEIYQLLHFILHIEVCWLYKAEIDQTHFLFKFPQMSRPVVNEVFSYLCKSHTTPTLKYSINSKSSAIKNLPMYSMASLQRIYTFGLLCVHALTCERIFLSWS